MLEAAAHRQGATRVPRARAGRTAVAEVTAIAPRILCIDDHALLLASLKRTFVQQGWTVATAVDAEAALPVLRRESFDAVIADLQLPGMSGLVLIKTMVSEGIDTPAIIYTAFPEPTTETEAHALGIPYVSKHEVRGVRDLAPIIHDVIDRHRARRESSLDDVARLLATTALVLTTEGMVSADWRASVSARFVRAMIDAALPHALFLTIAETLRVLHDPKTAPWSAAAFMRLQADRCRKRSELAQAIRLDRIAATVDWAAAMSSSISPTDTMPIDDSRAGVTKALRAMGWSYDDVIRGVVLRRAVTLAAHTPEQVAQIGYQLGFDHPTAFNRFFKHLLGLAPTEFRHFVHKR